MKPVEVLVRNTETTDFDGIEEMCREVYPQSPPWNRRQLTSHLGVFPEGQWVAVEVDTQRVVGMSSSLIVLWDDYNFGGTWKDFTDNGYFTNHDPTGRTLYAAEVMVRPTAQGHGIGKLLYRARRDLVIRKKLLRIRAGARLRGFHRYADALTAEEYVIKVVRRELTDPTLSFQLGRGFHVLGVVSGYLQNDPESLGYAAVIEWMNHKVARPKDYADRDKRFLVGPRTTRRIL